MKGCDFMTTVKEQILNAVNTLPDDVTWEDALYSLYLNAKLKKSEDDIKNGKVITIEESKERMKQKYEDTFQN